MQFRVTFLLLVNVRYVCSMRAGQGKRYVIIIPPVNVIVRLVNIRCSPALNSFRNVLYFLYLQDGTHNQFNSPNVITLTAYTECASMRVRICMYVNLCSTYTSKRHWSAATTTLKVTGRAAKQNVGI